MIRVLIVAGVVVVALLVSRVLGQRRAQAPTQVGYTVPTQLDRADFSRVDAPWLAVAFTSATCSTCADVARKLSVLESPMVAVDVVEYGARRDLHDKYGVEAVPSVVFSDADGFVQTSFIGPVSATDLWAGLARVRDGGATGDCRRETEAS
jgi:hypothetical protein